jgi:hypothetical protein
MRIDKYKDFTKVNEEASPRLPKEAEYWLKKGKKGKKVALYTHDDMDGIFSAIEVKKYLLDKGFEIVKYGILDYSNGWKYTKVDPELINVVVDFANMPGDERDQYIDYYLDHHGVFTKEQKERYKNSPVSKAETASAYEAVCLNLQVPQDDLVVSAVRMIDAAKYDEYKVSWKRLLDYNLTDIIKFAKKALTKKEGKELSLQGRLEFAAAFNQMLKRGDHKTLISVIHNCRDASIYSIFHTMRRVYPKHNVNFSGPYKGQGKDFLKDAEWRLRTMEGKTRGTKRQKKVYNTQGEFLIDFQKGGTIFSDGYALIGTSEDKAKEKESSIIAFVPTGVWANALRARTIIMEDYEMGIIMSKIEKAIADGTIDKLEIFNVDKLTKFLSEEEIYLFSRRYNKGSVWTIPELPKFILLQYGSTLQVCSYSDMKEMKELPKYKSGPRVGQPINDLGQYMTYLLDNFKEYLNYYDPDTSIGQDEITVSGGHGGIGSISNVFGKVKIENETDEEGNQVEVSKIILNNEGKKYVDLFKNKIIGDLSGITWGFGLKWAEDKESTYKAKEPDMDFKVLGKEDVTKLDNKGNPISTDDADDSIKTFSESFDYHIRDKDGNTKGVSRDEFVKAGLDKGMKPKEIQIDNDNKIIIAKFEKFINK